MKKLFIIGFTVAVMLLQPKKGSCQNSSDSKTYATQPATENYFNTVTGKIGNSQYKFVLIGDNMPVFAIDKKQIDSNELLQYEDLLDSLSNVVWERQRKEAQKKEQYNLKKKQEILTELVQQKIAATKDAVKSFYLTADQLKVNGVQVSQTVFEFFKKKYIHSYDKVFYYEQ